MKFSILVQNDLDECVVSIAKNLMTQVPLVIKNLCKNPNILVKTWPSNEIEQYGSIIVIKAKSPDSLQIMLQDVLDKYSHEFCIANIGRKFQKRNQTLTGVLYKVERANKLFNMPGHVPKYVKDCQKEERARVQVILILCTLLAAIFFNLGFIIGRN